MQCKDFERLAVLYACDELAVEERSAVEQHAATCAACAAVLAQEQELVAAISEQAAEVSPVLLAQCRGDFSDALDDVEHTGWRRRMPAWLHPGTWFAVRPAWSAALLIILGITLGIALPNSLQSPEQQSAPVQSASAVVVRPEPALSGQDVRSVSRISFVPGDGAASPDVRLFVDGDSPRTRTGTPDDGDVRRALLYVLQNNLQFDSGMRMDSLEALRGRGGDADVRSAFCYAARNDRNPGVRLKALEALRGFEQDEAVRRTFMEALVRDDNPGVRVEAINALRAMAERPETQPDGELVNVLRDRMQHDSNSYIRMQSAAAMRKLGPRAQF